MNRLDALLYTIAFSAYLAGFFGFVLHVSLKKEIMGKIATFLMMLGIIPHSMAFIVRWTAQGHYPLANMYEYMGLMAWMVVVGLLYFIWRYKNIKIGVIVAPVAVMLLVTASLLPSDINSQLMPALQSSWLAIHVTMAALGSGAFLIAFASASLYLLTISNNKKPGDVTPAGKEWFFFGLFWVGIPIAVSIILNVFGLMPVQVHSIEEARINGIADKMLTSFSLSTGSKHLLLGKSVIGLGIGMIFGAILWPFLRRKIKPSNVIGNSGSQFFVIIVTAILFSAVIIGYMIKSGTITLTPRSYMKIFEFFGPLLVLSWIMTPVMYYLLLILGGGWMERLSLPRPILEELSYSAVTIGYPLYTVGALFAGAIWAEQAWGTWWSWDPKEVGALIIWLFYTGFLHARYQRQWKSERAAIFIVLGMVMVFVSFFGNYFFGGLHSFEVT
ncbi:MAG: cytochrome c biogenesis protein CcsA [Candidatus Electryonea clarkiae]|nr:cytochrome c biogenesis protein CcsA [Candidatus Electryonea clarkiae]MDP8285157.1 cytochrome c biogenesis protein CcsA [Candidatus Electryonea clarkiae]